MALTRTARRHDLAELERGRDEEASMAELATRLAQEGVGLVAVELRRLAAEVRMRKRFAARTAAALLIGAAFAWIGTLSLAGGAVLYLGRVWGDHAAAAAAIGALLLIMALVAVLFLRSAARQLGPNGDEPDEPATDERNPDHVA